MSLVEKESDISGDDVNEESKVAVDDIVQEMSLSQSGEHIQLQQPAAAPVANPTDLTEEDIFRMKNLSARTNGPLSETAEHQSVVSLADSMSNFEEHVAVDEGDGSDGIGEDVSLCDDRDHSHNGSNASANDEPPELHREPVEPVDQGRVFAGFVFGRQRPAHPDIPKDTVTVLQYPFPPKTIPNGEIPRAYHDALRDATVYLVGTAHYSPNSQQDVLRTIASTQPDMVMVELCPSRISILSMDEETLLREAQSLNLDKILTTIKQAGLVQGMLHVLLLSISAHITRDLGMAPGGEFRAAHRGALNVKYCKLILGDRPLHVTLQRALGSLSFFQKLRLFYHILLSHFSSITQEEVEQCKDSDILVELLKKMAGEYPMLSKILVEERDLYMTNALHTLLRKATYDKRMAWDRIDVKWQPVTVVAVVGIGHVPGIVANWEKTIDVGPLLSIPEPSRSSKLLRLTVKGLFVGCAAYGMYRLVVRARAAFH